MDTKFCKGSFLDFKGKEHKFVVAVVAKPYLDDKVLSIGISICNPGDETHPGDAYVDFVGERQSEGRAIKYNDRLIASTKSGILNEALAQFLCENTAENLIKNPGLFIKGYNVAAEKWKKQSNGVPVQQ